MTVQNLIKKIILPVLLLLLVVDLSAQRSLGQIDRILAVQEDIELTDAQIENLQSLRAETKEKMASLKELEKAERKTQVKAAMEELRAGIEKILTPEQVALLKDKREEKRAKAEDRKEKKKALKKELKVYQKEEIKPVMRAQRQKLEADISPEDRLAINDLRAQLKDTKKERKEKATSKQEGKSDKGKRKAKAKGKKKRSSTAKNSSIGHLLRNNEQAKQTAEGLVSRYEERIKELNEEIAAQQEKWSADQEAIKDKYRADGEARRKEGMHGHKGHSEERAERKEFIKTLGFILMSPDQKDHATKGTALQNNAHQLRAYPNPASQTQTLELVIAETGNVNIELVDKSGKSVKSVFKGTMDAGTHSLQVDVSGLPDDVFFYRVTDANGVSSKQAVISKE